MADWYVSSAVYSGLATWAASTAYTVGNLIKPTAPATGREYVFRCTTAGTSGSSEPSWATAASNASTVSDGGAVWTNVSGQSTYGWSAAAGSLFCISNAAGTDRTSVGDRVFLSSDHSESGKGQTYGFNNGIPAFGLIEIISVNRAGSVPPVAADITNGAAATISTGGLAVIEAFCNTFWQGVTITVSTNVPLNFNSGGMKSTYLKNCALALTGTGSLHFTSTNPAKVILDDTTVQFGAAGQNIAASAYPFEWTWINTPSAIQGATIPTTLFVPASSGPLLATLRGIDLSAITGTLVGVGSNLSPSKVLLDSCKIAAAVTRYATPGVNEASNDEIELVNCYDGTNVLNERYTAAGSLVTDRSTYLTSGAQDDIGNYSLKLASSSRSDFTTMPLEAFWLDVENTLTGTSKTATVEIISSASLNNNDIRLLLEYQGNGVTSTTWNPADLVNVNLSGGNLIESPSGVGGVRSVASVSSGKYYFEYTFQAGPTAGVILGIANASANLSNVVSTGTGAAVCVGTGSIVINGTTQSGSLPAFSTGGGAICCVAVDIGAALIWFRNGIGGQWNGSGTADPATGTGGYSFSGLTGGISALYALVASNSALEGNVVAKFGASAFSGVVPSGFLAGFGATYQLANFVDSLPSVLTAASALPSSSNTWNNPPSTPQKQLLQVPFTPQRAGRVRGLVRLGKVSTTVWVNPQIAIA